VAIEKMVVFIWQWPSMVWYWYRHSSTHLLLLSSNLRKEIIMYPTIAAKKVSLFVYF
jgi:hypothetical protein